MSAGDAVREAVTSFDLAIDAVREMNGRLHAAR